MTRQTFLTALALLLSGCATPQPPVREVPVPIPVACRPLADKLPPRHPTYEWSKVRRSDTLTDKVRALLIERDQRAITEALLWAALEGCMAQPQP